MTRTAKAPTVPAGAAHLGERLRIARAAKRLSQAQLAKASGVGQRPICNYESGGTHPNAIVIEKLAAALGISASWLAFGDEK